MDVQALFASIGLPGQTIATIAVIVAVIAAIMPALPVPSGSGVYAVIYKILSIVAQNYGNAKNAPAPSPTTKP
tara:strand:+ start:1105 stop:1323 length:219 start_codon:yes stop_codon:yes gene_type:complete